MARKKKSVTVVEGGGEGADVFAQIKKNSSANTMSENGMCPYFVDTGNLSLNWVLSGRFIDGGFPAGRMIEAYGPEASGKSLLGYIFLGNIQRAGGYAVKLDCEHSDNAEFARNCGRLDPDKVLLFSPPTYEGCEKKIQEIVELIRKHAGPDVPIGIVWDSISVCMTDREWRSTDLPENPTEKQIKDAGGNERPGERARKAGDVLRRLNPFLADNKATLYIINQTRQKIGTMMGSDETTAGGGNALKFYASMRIRTSAPRQFFDKRKFPIGSNLKITTKKNRFNTSGIAASDIPLFASHGINPLGGLVQTLVYAGRLNSTSPGNYVVDPEITGGEEVKVKAALAKPLNPEILYRFPALIDATSEEQVRTYLATWEDAMALANDDSIEEVDSKSKEAMEALGYDADED